MPGIANTLRTNVMNNTCSVIGWVLDADRTKIIVREENGLVFAQSTGADGESEPSAIQTGAFRRGKRIVDPQTKEFLGYEMERIADPLTLAG
jgi:hypothetical protein